MSTFLFESPLEFLLRYTVITGVVIAIIGVVLCLIAKRATMAVRKSDDVSKDDKVYRAFLFTGIALILIGMIVIALPVENTFYVVAA